MNPQRGLSWLVQSNQFCFFGAGRNVNNKMSNNMLRVIQSMCVSLDLLEAIWRGRKVMGVRLTVQIPGIWYAFKAFQSKQVFVMVLCLTRGRTSLRYKS